MNHMPGLGTTNILVGVQHRAHAHVAQARMCIGQNLTAFPVTDVGPMPPGSIGRTGQLAE